MQLELKMAIMRMASKAAALAALWLTIKPFHIFIGSRCVATMFRPHQPTLDPPSKTNKKQKNNHQRNSWMDCSDCEPQDIENKSMLE